MSGIMTRNGYPDLAAGSRFGQRIRRRYASQLDQMESGVPTRQTMQALFETLCANGSDIGSALRTVRQLVVERLVCLDCNESASLQTITGAMTELAEFALDIACNESARSLDLIHGAPLGPQGTRADLCIVGMGKLGARELNVSSGLRIRASGEKLQPVQDRQGFQIRK